MPVRLDGAGRESGGGPFSRGHLYKLLANPIYTGHLAHKGRTFPGQHAAIVEESTFAAVGAQLGANTQARRRARSSSEALLMGRLRDDRGEAMSPSSAAKGGARYRYYTSQALLQGRKAEAGSVARVPAPEIEGVVLDVVQALAGPEPDGSGREYAADRMECWVEAVTVRKGAVEIRLTPEGASRTGTPTLIVPWSPPRTTRSRAVIGPAEGGAAPCRAMPSDVRRTLLVSVAKARSWMGWLASGEAADAEAIARREGRSERHVRMLLPLAGLAPDLIEAAVEGRMPEGAGVTGLIAGLPLAWAEQRARVAVLPAP